MGLVRGHGELKSGVIKVMDYFFLTNVIFNTSKKNNKPVKIYKAHNLSSVVVYQVVIFSRLQWKQELCSC